MNCKETLKWIADARDYKALPDEVGKHIDSCDDCRQLLEDNRYIAQIVSLKRYERPVMGSEERIASAIQAGLAASGKNDLGRFMWNDMRYFLKPVCQIAAAAIFIVLIGSFFFKRSATDHGANPQISDVPTRQMPYSQPDWMAAQTNPVPGHIQYGPGPSRMVEFELDEQ